MLQGKRTDGVRHAMLCMARQCWEQGLAAQALMEMGDEAGLILMAHDCVMRQRADGRLCDVEGTPALVDPAICVEAVLRAAELAHRADWRAAAMRNVEYLRHAAPRSQSGAYYQLDGSCEVWADSLGMGPHVLALTGHAAEGVDMFRAVRDCLLDDESGLYRHKWDEARGVFSREVCWGVGNGWALTGLMRMVRALKSGPEADWARAEFLRLYAAILPWQDLSGAFHDVLNDTQSFLETEFTEMFAYSVANMVLLGVLPDSALEAALRARDYARGCVDEYGWVRGCAGSPTFEAPGVSTECQAHFLMMEAAFAKLGRI